MMKTWFKTLTCAFLLTSACAQAAAPGARELKEATFVAPMSSATFAVSAGAAGQVTWKLISDYGGVGAEHASTR